MSRGGRREGAGRPAGARNKIGRDVKAKLHALADVKLVPTIARLLESKDERVQMEAARELANRVLGKVGADLHVSGSVTLQAQMHERAVERGIAIEALRAPDPASAPALATGGLLLAAGAPAPVPEAADRPETAIAARPDLGSKTQRAAGRDGSAETSGTGPNAGPNGGTGAAP